MILRESPRSLPSPLHLAQPVEVVTSCRGLERCHRSDAVFAALDRVEKTGGEVMSIRVAGRFIAPESVDAINCFLGVFGLRRFALHAQRQRGPERAWRTAYGLRFLFEYLDIQPKGGTDA